MPGRVWNGIHLLTRVQVAIKEEMPPEKDEFNCSLPYEATVYKLLRGHEGIPRIHWYGMHADAHIIVMDRLGPNLQHLRRMCRGQLSLKTVLMLAEQMVRLPKRFYLTIRS